MKRVLSRVAVCCIALILLAVTAGTGACADRRIEITPFGGYQWGGSLRGYEGEITVPGAGNWGIALDIEVRRDTMVELVFSRQYSSLQVRPYCNYPTPGVDCTPTWRQAFDMATEYYHVGGLYEINTGGGALPFTSMTLGATRFAPDDDTYGSEWKFSAALGIGVKVPVGERLGIRLQARFLLPFLWSSGGLWCGTGGCSIGVGGGSSFVQGDIAAGLTIKL
jgi:hypothetical protein